MKTQENNLFELNNVAPIPNETGNKDIAEVLEHLAKRDKRTIVAMAPSVRVSLGEFFGSQIGENVRGKMISALRLLGFDDVFDIVFGADLTIVEEANEFAEVLKNKRKKPLFTSCCPAWTNYVEKFYPEFIPNLSTCKSPQQMMSATIKTFYANLLKEKPENLFFVSIMPCYAKKFERINQSSTSAGEDTDVVLTVSELAEMIKMKNLDFMNLKEGKFDDMLGLSSGAGLIFGATGGVMEASLRTVCDIVPKKPLKKVDYLLVRGLSGTKEAEIEIGDKKVKIAVVSGLDNAKTLLEKIKSGEKDYDFVEVMACPGGCVNGSGMPRHENVGDKQLADERAENLYASDEKHRYRRAHKNPSIKYLYKHFFGAVGGERAHKILHTNHFKQKN
jgi:iron-only hydrogenase group A